MKKKIEIELIPYPYAEEIKKIRDHGWGCGYVKIPKGHPILIKRELKASFRMFDLYGDGFHEEISFAEWDDEYEFFKIGFDTMQPRHDSSNDLKYVTDTTLELKEIVENYTMEDAEDDVENYIKEIKLRLLNELDDMASLYPNLI